MNVASIIPGSFPSYLSMVEINLIRAALLQTYRYSSEINIPRTLRGNELFPMICNILADYFVMELCDAGEIPYTYKEEYNQAKNCHHAKFIHNSSRLQFTINKTEDPNSFPRKSIFRTKYAANNPQTALWEDDAICDDFAYLIYTHGGNWGECSFLSVGFPQNGRQQWAHHPWVFYVKNKEEILPVATYGEVGRKKPQMRQLTNHVIERL